MYYTTYPWSCLRFSRSPEQELCETASSIVLNNPLTPIGSNSTEENSPRNSPDFAASPARWAVLHATDTLRHACIDFFTYSDDQGSLVYVWVWSGWFLAGEDICGATYHFQRFWNGCGRKRVKWIPWPGYNILCSMWSIKFYAINNIGKLMLCRKSNYGRSELSTGRMNPRVGSGHDFAGFWRVGSGRHFGFISSSSSSSSASCLNLSSSISSVPSWQRSSCRMTTVSSSLLSKISSGSGWNWDVSEWRNQVRG